MKASLVAVFRSGRMLGFCIFAAGSKYPVQGSDVKVWLIAQCRNIHYLLRRASEYRNGRRLPVLSKPG
jgi:hypothetical protein